jgi:glycosyltransferase involved in cell wall biosynthesis
VSGERAVDDRPPTVSIGVPVYNGENFLGDAIESVLAQSVGDFELILCDNASTDGTRAICEAYAARDRRIRYYRNPRNLGAAANYNRAFMLTRGRYFKWLAHDDRLHPAFLEQTVAVMEARPEVVLCGSQVEVIDAQGAPIGTYGSILSQADVASPAERFAVYVLRPHTGVDIFALIRRSALEGSLLHSHFHGADRALLAQLALRGAMVQIPATLNQIREHDQRYTRRAKSARLRLDWHGSSPGGIAAIPILQLYQAYRRVVAGTAIATEERWRCRATLARWWLVNWNSMRVAVDIAALVVPDIVGFAEGVKERLVGASAGHFKPPR